MSVLLWPVKALFAAIFFIISAVGRLVAVIMGLFFVAFGMFLMVTVVGIPVGIPLFVFGLLILLFSVI